MYTLIEINSFRPQIQEGLLKVIGESKDELSTVRPLTQRICPKTV